MNQTGVYEPGSSWLYRLDPRVRLAWSFSFLLLTLLTPLPAVSALLLTLVHILLLAGGVHSRRLLQFWWTLLPLLLAILIMQPIVSGIGGKPLFTLAGVAISHEGILQAVSYALKLAGAAFAVFFPLVTTPIHQIIQAFSACGLPHRASLTLGLALHYLGLIGDLYTSIMEAQQARGLDLTHGGFFKRARVFFPTLIALIIQTLRISDSLALSLSARGFGLIGPSRTSLMILTLQKKDWLLLAANLVFFGVILVLIIG